MALLLTNNTPNTGRRSGRSETIMNMNLKDCNGEIIVSSLAEPCLMSGGESAASRLCEALLLDETTSSSRQKSPLLLSTFATSSTTIKDKDKDEAELVETSLTKVNKRPFSQTSSATNSTGSGTTTSTTRSSAKRQRLTSKKRVHFHSSISINSGDTTQQQQQQQEHDVQQPVTTHVKLYELDYDSKDDIWWTGEETRAHWERQSSLLEFYATNCRDYVDSVLMVWVHCAEQALQDGQYCMTHEQRHFLAHKIASSPVRGFEKELGHELIAEQRYKTIAGILELQHLCHVQNIPLDRKIHAMAAASTAFSQTATFFAQTMAQADAAQVVNGIL